MSSGKSFLVWFARQLILGTSKLRIHFQTAQYFKGMATRNPILLRSHWIINNQLTLPYIGIDNGKTTVRGLIQFVLPITIFLDTLFTEAPGFTSRRLEDDRLPIYKSVEGMLHTMGIDGKSCLLRTICEMQDNPIGEFSVVGEIVSILLKPNSSGRNEFLHEYVEAEYIGQMKNISCAREYSSCPVSLFNLFDSEDAEEDLEHEAINKEPVVRDPLQELEEYWLKHPSSGSIKKPPKQGEHFNSIDF